MHKHEVDIWGWSETNVNWTPNMISKTKHLGNKCFNIFTLTASLSDDPAEHKQQGGTCLGIVNKFTGRIIAMENDSRDLGCWSFVKLAGGNQKQITIVTAYQPCKQNKPGNATVNEQQHCLLRQQGIQHPQPHTQWFRHLLPLLQTWKREGEVFLMVDANSSIDDKDFA
eukprot:5288118-Ditylum_brightwellii.AAC.1